MEAGALEEYLHHQIPLSVAMRVTVCSSGPDAVVLAAPLEPNINHKRTAFGGSLSTLGILAAWSLLHLRLADEGLDCEVVIQSNRMDYVRPATGAFIARSALAAPGDWPNFRRTLLRRRLARVEVCADLVCGEETVGRLSGRFVAFLRQP